jgi:tetratricopeptide (TPR) repeat protein
MRVYGATARALVVGIVVALARSGSLEAQYRSTVPNVRCPTPVPPPFSLLDAPTVTVRLIAEGDFPDPDVAAARAISVLIRDILTERAPVTRLSSIDVQRRISSSLSSTTDMSEISPGGRLLSGVVRRIGDSVSVVWNLKTAGYDLTSAETHRITVRIDDVSRIALLLAETAAQASVASSQSLGTPPPSLGSVDAGEAYVNGLAEVSSTRPDALRRARAALVKATTIATAAADVWRWRARTENALIEWNRASGENTVKGLQVTLVGSAMRAVQLSPRSAGAHVALADAYLASGDRERAEQALATATSLDADGPGVGRVSSELSRIRGNDARALAELRTAVQMAPRDGELLVALANLARLRGDLGLACYALNAAVASDDELAPAYALRSLVRAELGERRTAWVDAETATRLGHPEWGERAAAVLDAKYGDRFHADVRLDAVGGLLARPANYLDAILLAQAAVATSRRGSVPNLAAAWPCKELRRTALVRDLRSLGATVIDSCTAATSFGGTVTQPPVPRRKPD